MKEMNKQSSASISESRAAEKFAQKYINEHNKELQTSLEYQGMLSGLPVLDPDEELASNVFAGAIIYATNIFGNRLVFGCGDYRKEDKIKIIEHLKKVLAILNK